jgi:hypothetical protein
MMLMAAGGDGESADGVGVVLRELLDPLISGWLIRPTCSP